MTVYYFSPSSSSGNGVIDSPYGDLFSINSLPLSSGDYVLLQGGSIFNLTGQINIYSKTGITFSTYNDQIAKINVSGSLNAFRLTGSSNITFNNLDFAGSGYTSFSIAGSTNSGVKINNCIANLPDYFINCISHNGDLTVNNCKTYNALKDVYYLESGNLNISNSYSEKAGLNLSNVASADQYGAVFNMTQYGQLTAKDCVFLNNKRVAYCVVPLAAVSHTMSRCQFVVNNTSGLTSVGANQHFIGSIGSTVTVDHSLFYTSGSTEYFHAISYLGGFVTISDSVFASEMNNAFSYFHVVPDASVMAIINSLVYRMSGATHAINVYLGTNGSAYNRYIGSGNYYNGGLQNWTTYSAGEVNSNLITNPYLLPFSHKDLRNGGMLKDSILVTPTIDISSTGVKYNADYTPYQSNTVGPWPSEFIKNKKQIRKGRLGRYGYTPD